MVALIFVVCSSAFAFTSYDGSSVPTIWDSSLGKRVDIPNITKITDGVAGKALDDSYYYVDAACSSINSGFYNLGSGNTLECQFMLKDDASALNLRANLYFANNKANGNDAKDYNKLIVDSAGMRFYGGKWSSGINTLNWDISYDIVPGRWYTLVAEYEDKSASEGLQNGKFYINGELIKEDTSLGTYGFRNLAIGPVDGAHGVYVDNVVCSNSRGADSNETYELDVERSKVSYITNIANGAVVNEELGVVMAISTMTVGDIKSELSTTDGANDNITIYNQDFTTVSDDNDSAIGKVIVIGSKNGALTEQAYNYYDITELDLDKELGMGKNVSDLVVYDSNTTVTSVAGNYGKLVSDDVYKIVSTSKEQIHIPKSFANGAGTLGDYGVLRFQFALEPGAYVTLVLNGDAEDSVKYRYGKERLINLYENTVSVGTKGSSNESPSNAEIKNKRWYSAAITIPTVQDDNNNAINVYINGKIVLSINETEMKSFRRPTLNIYNGYLDNISVSEGSNYNPLVDTPAYLEVNDGVAAYGKISYVNKPQSYADFTLADTSTSLRFYDADWTTTGVADAKYVVAAGKDESMVERVLKYYEVESDSSDYILAAYTIGNLYKVKAYSEDAACLYIATYDSTGSLISVTPFELNNEWIEKNVAADSKVMLWKNDDTITPLKPVATFDLIK